MAHHEPSLLLRSPPSNCDAADATYRQHLHLPAVRVYFDESTRLHPLHGGCQAILDPWHQRLRSSLRNLLLSPNHCDLHLLGRHARDEHQVWRRCGPHNQSLSARHLELGNEPLLPDPRPSEN